MKQSVYADVRAAKQEMAEDLEDAARETEEQFYGPTEYEDPYWPATNEPSREYMPDFFDDEDDGFREDNEGLYDLRDYIEPEDWPTWYDDTDVC